MRQAAVLAFALIACGGPRQPAPVEYVEVVADAADAVADAAVDAAERTSPPHAVAPGVLTSATQIVIEDEWAGMGCSYKFAARLERKDEAFSGTATLEVYRTQSKDVRDVTLAMYEVEALQQMLSAAEKSPDPGPSDRQRGWTDDYPKGSTILSGPQDAVKIFFLDQQRQLLVEHGGRIQALGSGSFGPGGPSSEEWRKYRVFLDAVGLHAMRAKRCNGW